MRFVTPVSERAAGARAAQLWMLCALGFAHLLRKERFGANTSEV